MSSSICPSDDPPHGCTIVALSRLSNDIRPIARTDARVSWQRSITWFVWFLVFVAVAIYYLIYKLQNPSVISHVENRVTYERAGELFDLYSPTCTCSNISMQLGTMFANDPTCSAITVLSQFQVFMQSTFQSLEGAALVMTFLCSPPSVTLDDANIIIGSLQDTNCNPSVCGTAFCTNATAVLNAAPYGIQQMFAVIAAFGSAPGYAGGICQSDIEAQQSAVLVRSALNIMNNELASYLQSPLLFSPERFVQAVKDTARQQTTLEQSTTILQYGSAAFYLHGNLTATQINTRLDAYRQVYRTVSEKVISILSTASYENYFHQCNPISCQYFAEDTQAAIFFNSLGTLASFFAVCMAIARFGYACTHRPLVQLSPDGYYVPAATPAAAAKNNASPTSPTMAASAVAEMTAIPSTLTHIAGQSSRTLLPANINESSSQLNSVVVAVT